MNRYEQIHTGGGDCRSIFNCDRSQRLLHSFPTRRSSDLSGHENSLRSRLTHPGYDLILPRQIDDGARSEEHTSELQSRRDLVCRLLLEKKKTSYRSEG